jgi:hypothetical protein
VMGGAALSALFGAASGAPGKSAAIGAGVGALGGGDTSANNWNYLYNRALHEGHEETPRSPVQLSVKGPNLRDSQAYGCMQVLPYNVYSEYHTSQP